MGIYGALVRQRNSLILRTGMIEKLRHKIYFLAEGQFLCLFGLRSKGTMILCSWNINLVLSWYQLSTKVVVKDEILSL